MNLTCPVEHKRRVEREANQRPAQLPATILACFFAGEESILHWHALPRNDIQELILDEIAQMMAGRTPGSRMS